jgi:hypothetical protein
MKAALLITSIIALAGLTSCEKEEYKCVCTGGFGGNHYEEKTIEAKDAVKARKKCQESGDDYNTPDGIYCELTQ